VNGNDSWEIEEFAELHRAVALMKLRDRLTGLGVECREERRSPVPHVVMRAALPFRAVRTAVISTGTGH